MRCQTIGRKPTFTSGLGTVSECSRSRVLSPPQNRTTFILLWLPTSVAPEQVVVDLAGLLQVAQLLQPREGPELVGILRHLDALKHLVQLPHAGACAPLRLEAGQLHELFKRIE